MSAHTTDTVVVLTALNLEYSAVRSRLTVPRQVKHGAGTLFEVGQRTHGTVVVGLTGPGNAAAALTTERAIAMFHPHAVVFVGIAGALHADLELGDVVVATRVYGYHGGIDEVDGFRARPEAWQAPHELDQLAHQLVRTEQFVHSLISGPDNGRTPQVVFRSIAAGEVVLNSSNSPLANQLRRTYDDAGAIEMESAGTARAAHFNRSLPWMTIRGISDKADGRKLAADGAGYQTVAAHNAAVVAMALIDEILRSDDVVRPSEHPVTPIESPAIGTDRYRYDVCLSFADEQRSYVEAVAHGLRDRGIRVFYDSDELVDLWGKDLYSHLDEVYGRASRYCVLFASNDYATKIWTNHERRSAQARALSERAEYILPARFDETKIPGLLPTVGYIDLRNLAPDGLVELIARKLHRLSGPEND